MPTEVAQAMWAVDDQGNAKCWEQRGQKDGWARSPRQWAGSEGGPVFIFFLVSESMCCVTV